MKQELTGVRARAKERSQRIKSELARFGSLRALHTAVLELCGADTRGTSYGGIRAIVAGETDHPRPNVLQAMAEVLGVRFEYLMDLEDVRTESEMRDRGVAPQTQEVEKPWMDSWAALDDGMRRLPLLWSHAQYYGGRSLLKGLATDLLESGGAKIVDWSVEEIHETVFLLGSLMALPAQAMYGTASNILSRPLGREDEYFQAMALAIRGLLPRGDPRGVLAALRSFYAALPGSHGPKGLLDLLGTQGDDK